MMSEQRFTRITLSTTGSYYSEQETADYCRLEVQVLRQLSESGVIPGMDIVGEEVRYSDEDLALLRRARRLYEDLGVNLEGIEIILRLLARLDASQRELDDYKKRGK
jgi:MerR family transcriptional regulator, heat shock protein HspR